jgi:hypothetical protein
MTLGDLTTQSLSLERLLDAALGQHNHSRCTVTINNAHLGKGSLFQHAAMEEYDHVLGDNLDDPGIPASQQRGNMQRPESGIPYAALPSFVRYFMEMVVGFRGPWWPSGMKLSVLSVVTGNCCRMFSMLLRCFTSAVLVRIGPSLRN